MDKAFRAMPIPERIGGPARVRLLRSSLAAAWPSFDRRVVVADGVAVQQPPDARVSVRPSRCCRTWVERHLNRSRLPPATYATPRSRVTRSRSCISAVTAARSKTPGRTVGRTRAAGRRAPGCSGSASTSSSCAKPAASVPPMPSHSISRSQSPGTDRQRHLSQPPPANRPSRLYAPALRFVQGEGDLRKPLRLYVSGVKLLQPRYERREKPSDA